MIVMVQLSFRTLASGWRSRPYGPDTNGSGAGRRQQGGEHAAGEVEPGMGVPLAPPEHTTWPGRRPARGTTDPARSHDVDPDLAQAEAVDRDHHEHGHRDVAQPAPTRPQLPPRRAWRGPSPRATPAAPPAPVGSRPRRSGRSRTGRARPVCHRRPPGRSRAFGGRGPAVAVEDGHDRPGERGEPQPHASTATEHDRPELRTRPSLRCPWVGVLRRPGSAIARMAAPTADIGHDETLKART